MECANCHAENDSSVRYCQACGFALESIAAPSLALALNCPHCHASNRPDAPFCRHCGQYLDAPLARFAADRRKRSVLGVALSLLALIIAAAYVIYGHQAGSQALDLAAPLQRLPPVAAEPGPAPVDRFVTEREVLPPLATVEEPEPQPAVRPQAEPEPTTATATVAATVAAPEPAAHRAPPRKSQVAKAAASREPPAPADVSPAPRNPPPAAPARVSQTPVRPATPDWYAGLKAEIRRCADAGNFFSRLICTEQAKFHFCGPGKHWGEVPECVKAQTATNNY